MLIAACVRSSQSETEQIQSASIKSADLGHIAEQSLNASVGATVKDIAVAVALSRGTDSDHLSHYMIA
jgi:hypothetical protein